VLKFLKKAVSDLYIASPPESAPLLVWRYPDRSIPNGAKLTVRADEVAVFFREGRVVGVLEAGAHVLETAHWKFLGDLVVSPLTGDNHFITEIFFVRLSDHLHTTGPRAIGSFTDSASRLLVQLGFVARYAVRAKDPLAIIVRLGGVREDASANVASFLDGRMASLVAACVGTLAEQHPIAQLASNQYSEQLGQYALDQARRSFEADGLELTRFLELHVTLDEPSRAALAEYSRRAADLQLQREGAAVATQPGFAQFHLVQGQRALLEGMAKHGAVMPMMAPIGLPMMTPMLTQPSVEVTPRSSSTVSTRLAAPSRWYLRTSSGVEGPYAARQVAIRALASGLDADGALVREEGTDAWLSAGEVEAIAGEFAKRARPALTTTHREAESAVDSFERALTVAVADGILTQDELALLVPLARAARLAPDEGTATEYVRMRAKALGARTADPEPPPLPSHAIALEPPPLPVTEMYVYSDGTDRFPGLTADAIAQRVRAAPQGVHLVWKAGMPNWLPAREIAAIRTLVE
jgi:membrane protease subunit (stomatin/prohibitin family)